MAALQLLLYAINKPCKTLMTTFIPNSTQKDIVKIFDSQYWQIAFKVFILLDVMGCLINLEENIPAVTPLCVLKEEMA